VRAATPSHAAELAVQRRGDLIDLVNGLKARASRAQAQRLALLSHRVSGLLARLLGLSPGRRIAERRARVAALAALLEERARARLTGERLRVSALLGKLTALSPERVLERGYALVTGEGGELMTSAGRARAGDTIRVRLRSGALSARVMEVYHGGEEKQGG